MAVRCPRCKTTLLTEETRDLECPTCGYPDADTRTRASNVKQKAIWAVVLGAVGIVSGFGIVFGPIAWWLAASARQELAAQGDPENLQGLALTGLILGIVATILSLVMVLLAGMVFILVADLGGDFDPPPTASWAVNRDGPGGVLTVAAVEGGPVWISDLEVGGEATGCQITDLDEDGALSPGDRLRCTSDGSLHVTHRPTDTLLFHDTI